MTKIFNNVEEIGKYYDKETNTYEFRENKELIDVVFDFDLNVDANIYAKDIKAKNIDVCNIGANDVYTKNIRALDINVCNIDACDIIACNIDSCDINALKIDAGNIDACDIIAESIDAWNISYYGICFVYTTIACKLIHGRTENSKHFVLDGKLIIKGENNDKNI